MVSMVTNVWSAGESSINTKLKSEPSIGCYMLMSSEGVIAASSENTCGISITRVSPKVIVTGVSIGSFLM